MSILEITGKGLQNKWTVTWKNKRSICRSIVTLTFNIEQLLIYNYVVCVNTKENYGKRGKLMKIKTLCATPGVSLQGHLYPPWKSNLIATFNLIPILIFFSGTRHGPSNDFQLLLYFKITFFAFRFQDVLCCLLLVHFLRGWVTKTFTAIPCSFMYMYIFFYITKRISNTSMISSIRLHDIILLNLLLNPLFEPFQRLYQISVCR